MKNYTTEKLRLDLTEDEDGELVDLAAIEWERQLSEGHEILEGRIAAPGEVIPEGAIALEGGWILEIVKCPTQESASPFNRDTYAVPDGIIDDLDRRDLGKIQTYVKQDSDGKYLTRGRAVIADRTKLTFSRATELLRKYHSGIRLKPINLDSPVYK
jgi:hypothetical protein